MDSDLGEPSTVGDSKSDPHSAIIKQDVMLSGPSTQSPVSSVLTMPAVAMSASSLPTNLGNDFFFSAVPALGPEANPLKNETKLDIAGSLGSLSASSQTLLGQPQVAAAAPQIILTGQANNPQLPVQQILIPISTANGTQQLLSIPVSLASNSGNNIQILATSNGQILATNLGGLNIAQNLNLATALNGSHTSTTQSSSSTATSILSAAAANNNGATRTTALPMPQIITNAQGQILAIGAPQLRDSEVKPVVLPQSSLPSSQQMAAAAGSLINAPQQSILAGQTSITAQMEDKAVTGSVVPSSQTIINASTPGLSSLTTANINQLLPNTVSNCTESTTVDGINLDEIKEFAKQFKIRRLSLGLTQTQVGQALSATEGPSYSQSAICRFEKLDITPKSAQKIKPVLERWMKEAEERYKNGMQNLTEFIGSEPSKKRKRRTSFTPQALEYLNQHFERSTHPSGAEMTELSEKLNYDREVIRVWFCNKRQALKNTIKKLKAQGDLQTTLTSSSLPLNIQGIHNVQTATITKTLSQTVS